MGATDQKKAEQFEDGAYAAVLTLSFKDRAQAEVVAATFNAACKSQGRLARAKVCGEVLPTPGTTVPPMPL